MGFNQHISEMKSLVNALSGEKGLNTKKYSIIKGGIKDNKTGVMLFVENVHPGVLVKLIHPKINYAVLEARLKEAGYVIKDKENAIIYYLKKAKDNLPDMIAIGCGGKEIGYYGLKTLERKKCLAPIKSLLFYLNS